MLLGLIQQAERRERRRIIIDVIHYRTDGGGPLSLDKAGNGLGNLPQDQLGFRYSRLQGRDVHLILFGLEPVGKILFPLRLRHALAAVETNAIDCDTGCAPDILGEVAHEGQAIAAGNAELDCGYPIDAETERQPRCSKHAVSIMGSLDRVEIREELSRIWVNAAGRADECPSRGS